ncbi:MAG: tetratricopeptide repeat protein [Sandaracinaceae bacterium]
MTRLAFAPLILLLVSAGPVSSARAQDATPMDEARTAFETGRIAYEDGRFEEALEAFQRAHELTQSPDILYNIGTVADRLRRDQLALDSYRGYLEARPDSPDRTQVEARVEVLDRQIRAEVEASAAREAAREADARALREAEEAARLAEEQQLAMPPPFEPSPVPWVLVATGGAVLVTGVALVVVASIDAACVSDPTGCVEEDTAPRWEEVAGAYDRIPVFQGVGGTLIGVGAVAAGVGLVWGLTQGGDDRSVALQVGPGSISVRGSF